MSSQIQQIQHTNPDVIVIGDYCISVTSHLEAERCSFEKIDEYLKKEFGISDATQAALSFVQSFYNVPKRTIMIQSHWRLFLIALVSYVIGKCVRRLSVHFLSNSKFHIWRSDDWYYETTTKKLYVDMFGEMWQKKPVVVKVATSYGEVEWIMSNGRPAEIEDKPSQLNCSSLLKLSVKKPDIRLNFN